MSRLTGRLNTAILAAPSYSPVAFPCPCRASPPQLHAMVMSYIERWRPKTHTFHLPCRECTITLEDVALQLGLPIDGNAITGGSSIFRPTTLCYELLGCSPSEGKFASLRFSWLKVNFEYLPSTANEWEVMQAVRAYIITL
ncbi:hypothetical protein J1N35_037383 [Gossypium stocksii]|uniref:Aminotransferase-like plant mobile domain-containing protein n=1 Tax=Gossypium stocksii TaxID=47602 RepID=A0A9D3UKN6_9ROSI|nr:hypothetical protein J1N35_037383 [Gossypium stocksii]